MQLMINRKRKNDMKKIEIKIGSQAMIRLFGYDAEATFPFSKWPQMQVHNNGDETYVDLNEKRIDELISALQEIKKTFHESSKP